MFLRSTWPPLWHRVFRIHFDYLREGSLDLLVRKRAVDREWLAFAVESLPVVTVWVSVDGFNNPCGALWLLELAVNFGEFLLLVR